MQFMVFCFEMRSAFLLEFVYALTKPIEIAPVMDWNDNPKKSIT